jgi:hypothetical protein
LRVGGSGELGSCYVLSEWPLCRGASDGWFLPMVAGLFSLGRFPWGGPDDLERKKGIRWMPWHQEAMKDVARCEKPWGAASRR